MQIQIRAATSADMDAIQRIYAYGDAVHLAALSEFFRKVDQPARPISYLQEHLDRDDAAIFLAIDDAGDAVGLLHLYHRAVPDLPMLVPRRYAMIEGLVVLPEAQRQGVGSALLRHAERWALSRGIDQVELAVWEFNAGARQFYESQNYGTIRRTMWKPLNSSEVGP